ncbi:hypothetical protein [Rhizobium sp. PL01]|uniref:hypothetical protein n=1 Tax=Rhizobium sp. PL01 TaxID=3085631 RepID=UPI00298292F1|nr:hypothetical protein [Rhizobium sp. PL01]MDW5315023.1 hypothetical protein [Rhizobium sp. PL01]
MKHRFFYNKRHIFLSRDGVSGAKRAGTFTGDLMGGSLIFGVSDKGQDVVIGELHTDHQSVDLPENGVVYAELSGTYAEPDNDIQVDVFVEVKDVYL